MEIRSHPESYCHLTYKQKIDTQHISFNSFPQNLFLSNEKVTIKRQPYSSPLNTWLLYHASCEFYLKKKWHRTIRRYKMQCFDATLWWNRASGSSISTKGRVRSLDMLCNWLLRLNEEIGTWWPKKQTLPRFRQHHSDKDYFDE